MPVTISCTAERSEVTTITDAPRGEPQCDRDDPEQERRPGDEEPEDHHESQGCARESDDPVHRERDQLPERVLRPARVTVATRVGNARVAEAGPREEAAYVAIR